MILLLILLLPTLTTAGFACLSNPCLHGVCLDDLNSSFFCYCIDGYTGLQCQTNWDDCWSNPCQNGGDCIDGIAGFNCTCPAGFIGDLCEVDFDECQSNPCLNGGVCMDGSNGYQCLCPAGYEGVHCEVDVSVCNTSQKCFYGLCQEGPGDTFSCVCFPGYEGTLCELETNECLSTPCQNGAVCLDKMADYECACLFGYSGKNCEEVMRVCDTNPCKNGALCLIEDGGERCYCVPDFHGDRCQLQYDECLLGPKCSNGGSCIDGVDTFTCSCPPQLTGIYCECLIQLDELDCNYTAPTTSKTTTEFETEPSTTFTFQPEPSVTTTAEPTTSVPTTKETTTILITTTEPPTTTATTQTETSTEPYTTTTEATTTTEPVTTRVTEPPTPTTTETTTLKPTNRTFPDYVTSITTTSPPETTFFTTDLTTPTWSPLDCTLPHQRCLNGGVCIYEEEGHKCSCPFDTEGLQCEVKLGIKNAAFNGGSYLTHKIAGKNFSVEFEARTLSREGLLFYLDLEGGVYMGLYLDEGFLKFKFSCGFQTMLLSELKVPVNNGYTINIKAHLDFLPQLCEARLRVNDTLEMTGDQKMLIPQSHGYLHLGGLPMAHGVPSTGFVGCMSNLQISGRKTYIYKEATDGFQISECSSLACLENPCKNGARCLARGDQWSCSCRNGFLGPTCDISICNNNPCQFGGTCIPFSSNGYICLCPYGKHGHFCENSFKITEPYFSSTVRGLSSFLAYTLPSGIGQKMEIRFRFTPTTMDQISLLLFIGQPGSHDVYSDHLSVSFVKGFIMLTWNMGSGPRRIFTAQSVDPGSRDYEVMIGYHRKASWLHVEGMGNITGKSPGSSINLDVEPLLYVGGHPSKNFSSLPHDLPLHTGFAGCVFDLEVKVGEVVLPLHGKLGRAVGQCGTTECYDRRCQNSGACLHHASTFMCLCQDGWYGPLCSSKVNFCDANYTQCAHEARCVPLMSGYECDCPYGLVGRECLNQDTITDVSFTGTRSFIHLEPQQLDSTKVNVEMEIRMLKETGVVFFIGGTGFMCLSIQNSQLELRVHSSKPRPSMKAVIVRSSKLLLHGAWHKVQFGVFGRKVYLYVDHVINMGVMDHGFIFSLTPDIYLGGLPDLSQLPTMATSSLPTPYTGCLRHLSINQKPLPLTPANIHQSRNVIDCDGTPCGGEACLNGGTCWLDNLLYPHCSCPEPYFGDKCEFMPKCTGDSCKNGRCHNTTCYCHVGFQGGLCETEIVVKVPQFAGRSFLVVQKGEKKRNVRSLELRKLMLNFTTATLEGIMVWTTRGDNFLGLGLENGFLKLTTKDKVDLLPFQVSDGLWHHVELNFNPLFLRVDNRTIKLGKINPLFSNGTFYIGGMPNGLNLIEETKGLFQHPFEGCVEAFGTNNEQVITDFTPFDGENIDNCSF